MKISKAKKIIALILAVIIIVGSVFIIRSCSAPPEYAEIKERFEELVNASHGVNTVIFGDGLPTYERVSDPRESVSVYRTGEYYTDKNGKEQERKVWYYYTLGTEKTVVAFRDSYLEKFSYIYVAHSEQSSDALSALFPSFDDASVPDGKSLYTELYRSEDGKDICYLVPYKEKEYDFYYSSDDPEDYDYVSNDSEYRTIDEIKAYAETVYSRNYMLSLYSSLFDGIASGDSVLKARYIEDSSMLAQSNTYTSLFSEQRVYIFDTARIVKWGSNSRYVRVEIESYLPSDTDNIVTVEVDLILQDGKWYLDSPTF